MLSFGTKEQINESINETFVFFWQMLTSKIYYSDTVPLKVGSID